MIVLVNGSFGVGKSTVAAALLERLPHAMLYDPEVVGYMARAVTEGVRSGTEATDDFQDIALWRSMVVAVAEELYRRYGRALVVPMTLSHPGYLREIRGGLERIGLPLHHFCLTAPLATIQQRLVQRGEEAGGWPWRKAEQCVAAFHGPLFERYVDAEQPVDVIVATILHSLKPLS